MRIRRIKPNRNRFVLEMPYAFSPAVVCRRKQKSLLLDRLRNNHVLSMFLRGSVFPLRLKGNSRLRQAYLEDLYLLVTSDGSKSVIHVRVTSSRRRPHKKIFEQDLALCRHAFPDLKPHLMAVQFIKDERGEVIVMFELILQNGELKLADEKHYRLVSASEFSQADLESTIPDS